MRATRTVRLLAVLAALSLAAGACSDDEEGGVTETGSGSGSGSASGTESGSGTEETTADGGGDLELVNEDQLTVCSDVPYEPFEMESDSSDSGYDGFDIDILEAIAAELGVTLEVRDSDFDGILLSLEGGDCDIVGSAMTITEEREENADFSEPYFDADQSLLILTEDEADIGGLADLVDSTIGVQSGTTGADYATENAPEGAEIREYESGADLFLALTAGDISAALQDFPVNAYQAAKDDSFTVTETFPTGEQYGFAVKQGNTALLEAVNEALATLRDEGTYDEIFAAWFGEQD
jgi:polar amino acid transport system substrate-binding protein